MDFAPTEEQRLLRESAAAFVRRHCPRGAVRRRDREGEFPETLHATMVEASMAKLHASEMLVRLTTLGMQVLGGHAYTYDHDMQRYWRDARNSTVGGGISQIQRQLIAREIGL